MEIILYWPKNHFPSCMRQQLCQLFRIRTSDTKFGNQTLFSKSVVTFYKNTEIFFQLINLNYSDSIKLTMVKKV